MVIDDDENSMLIQLVDVEHLLLQLFLQYLMQICGMNRELAICSLYLCICFLWFFLLSAKYFVCLVSVLIGYLFSSEFVCEVRVALVVCDSWSLMKFL